MPRGRSSLLGGILNRLHGCSSSRSLKSVFRVVRTRICQRSWGWGLRIPIIALLGYAGLVAAGVTGFQTMPIGFIPQQDKGYLVASIQFPDAAKRPSAPRRPSSRISAASPWPTRWRFPRRKDEEGAEKVKDGDGEKWVKKMHPVRHVNGIAGNSFVLSAYFQLQTSGRCSSSSTSSTSDATRRKLTADAVGLDGLRTIFAKAAVPEGAGERVRLAPGRAAPRAGRWVPHVMIEDRGEVGPQMSYQGQTENLIDKANQQPQLVGLFTVYKTNSPQVYSSMWIARRAHVRPAASGFERGRVRHAPGHDGQPNYVNDFNRFGRTWQVNVQSDMSGTASKLEDVRRSSRCGTRPATWCRSALWSACEGAERAARDYAVQHACTRPRP